MLTVSTLCAAASSEDRTAVTSFLSTNTGSVVKSSIFGLETSPLYHCS